MTTTQPQPVTPQRILVNDREGAALLGIGVSTFWREVKVNKLPQPVKIGGATRWRLADLQRQFLGDGAQ
jgi:predicted DNA-binding transcriptional regulator AlpA